MRTDGMRQIGIGHNHGPVWPLTPPVRPDAVAVIRQPARSVMTSGNRRTRGWVLQFERRTAPFLDPLMGGTGGDDPMVHVELEFPTKVAAISFGEREGLTYRVEARLSG